MKNKAFPPTLLIMAVLAGMTSSMHGQTDAAVKFTKTTVSRDFISEGVATGDMNKDGQKDIIAGYYWFEAPDWTRHEMAPSRTFNPWEEYSESFLNLGMDVNLDGWDDAIIIDYPGKAAFWFENPKNAPGNWEKHIIADSMGVSNESPGFVDIDGDGRLDILSGDLEKKQIVWLKAPVVEGEMEWQRFPLSRERVPGTEQYSHGIGLGDINGDGIDDVIITDGWFEGKADKASGDWEFHPTNIGDACSHMQVLDVNGDGKNDVVSASAHALGIWWHEQTDSGDFRTHLMSITTAQTHASIMADLNGDGRQEYITGKRYLAHNGRDNGDGDTPYLLYIEFSPGEHPLYKEYVIDNDSGAGLNIAVEDMNGDNSPDLIIANKNGIYLFENRNVK